MTKEQINQLFDEALTQEIKVSELEGITKDKIYNWRKGRNTHSISMGEKLNLLWQLGTIVIVERETYDILELVEGDNPVKIGYRVYNNTKSIEEGISLLTNKLNNCHPCHKHYYEEALIYLKEK